MRAEVNDTDPEIQDMSDILTGLDLTVANNVSENVLWSDADSAGGISVPGTFATIGLS